MEHWPGAEKGDIMTTELVRSEKPALPPVLHGTMTPEVAGRVGDFYNSVASIFEAWVGRRKSAHTQRAYRGDVMAFVEFMKWTWPDDATELLRGSILDVQAFKSDLVKHGAAPKRSTVGFRRSRAATSSLTALPELRLPITVPNPAHAQFISRESSDPVDETRALSAVRARQLMGFPGRGVAARTAGSRHHQVLLTLAGPSSPTAQPLL
jgi:hypothetical protein